MNWWCTTVQWMGNARKNLFFCMFSPLSTNRFRECIGHRRGFEFTSPPYIFYSSTRSDWLDDEWRNIYILYLAVKQSDELDFLVGAHALQAQSNAELIARLGNGSSIFSRRPHKSSRYRWIQHRWIRCRKSFWSTTLKKLKSKIKRQIN